MNEITKANKLMELINRINGAGDLRLNMNKREETNGYEVFKDLILIYNEIYNYNKYYSKYFITLMFEQINDVLNNKLEKLENVNDMNKLKEYFHNRYAINFNIGLKPLEIIKADISYSTYESLWYKIKYPLYETPVEDINLDMILKVFQDIRKFSEIHQSPYYLRTINSILHIFSEDYFYEPLNEKEVENTQTIRFGFYLGNYDTDNKFIEMLEELKNVGINKIYIIKLLKCVLRQCTVETKGIQENKFLICKIAEELYKDCKNLEMKNHIMSKVQEQEIELNCGLNVTSKLFMNHFTLHNYFIKMIYECRDPDVRFY